MKSKRIDYSNKWRKGFPYNIVKEPDREEEPHGKEPLSPVEPDERASDKPGRLASIHPDIVAPVLLDFEQIVRNAAAAQQTETSGASVKIGKEETAKPGNTKPGNTIEELYNDKLKAPDDPEA